MVSEDWMQKRKWTVINAYFVSIIFGLSKTIYYPTDLYYFRDTMKVEKPQIFFGTGFAINCGALFISSLCGGYYADKTKRVREILLASSAITIIGNVFFLLHISPYLVLFGKFLIGFGGIDAPALVGEFARVFQSDELTRNVSVFALFTSAGVLLGPCFVFLFQLVEVHIGWWILDVNNVVGKLFMVGCVPKHGSPKEFRVNPPKTHGCGFMQKVVRPKV